MQVNQFATYMAMPMKHKYEVQLKMRSPENYLISHSQTPYLMGPKGEPLAIMPADVPNTAANEGAPALVEAELAKWVR